MSWRQDKCEQNLFDKPCQYLSDLLLQLNKQRVFDVVGACSAATGFRLSLLGKQINYSRNHEVDLNWAWSLADGYFSLFWPRLQSVIVYLIKTTCHQPSALTCFLSQEVKILPCLEHKKESRRRFYHGFEMSVEKPQCLIRSNDGETLMTAKIPGMLCRKIFN